MKKYPTHITQTPWGNADLVIPLNGDWSVVRVHTPGHGGIGVNTSVMTMPKHLTDAGVVMGGMLWFEEDCNWCCPALAFPDLFPADREAAESTLRNWLPEIYKKHFGRMPLASESVVMRERELNAKLHNCYRPRTGFGDWAWDVPRDFVYVVGYRASDASTQGFLVPEAEYKVFDELVLDDYPHWAPDRTMPYSKPKGWRDAVAA